MPYSIKIIVLYLIFVIYFTVPESKSWLLSFIPISIKIPIWYSITQTWKPIHIHSKTYSKGVPDLINSSKWAPSDCYMCLNRQSIVLMHLCQQNMKSHGHNWNYDQVIHLQHTNYWHVNTGTILSGTKFADKSLPCPVHCTPRGAGFLGWCRVQPVPHAP